MRREPRRRRMPARFPGPLRLLTMIKLVGVDGPLRAEDMLFRLFEHADISSLLPDARWLLICTQSGAKLGIFACLRRHFRRLVEKLGTGAIKIADAVEAELGGNDRLVVAFGEMGGIACGKALPSPAWGTS